MTTQRQVVANSKTRPSTIFIQVVEHLARKRVVKRGSNAKKYYEHCTEVGYNV